MKQDVMLAQDVARLVNVEIEYDLTLRVLAVMVERVQELTGADEIQISDQAIYDRPDLSAWRNAAKRTICLKTAR